MESWNSLKTDRPRNGLTLRADPRGSLLAAPKRRESRLEKAASAAGLEDSPLFDETNRKDEDDQFDQLQT